MLTYTAFEVDFVQTVTLLPPTVLAAAYFNEDFELRMVDRGHSRGGAIAAVVLSFVGLGLSALYYLLAFRAAQRALNA